MHESVKRRAAGVVSGRDLQLLEERGISLMPKVIVELIHNCGFNEELISLPGGKFVTVREATPGDVERITKGWVCMD